MPIVLIVFLDNIKLSFSILLRRSKKVYLSRSNKKLELGKKFSRRRYLVNCSYSVGFYSSPYNRTFFSSKITSFFESSLVYDESFITNEYSSSYFNSYSSFYPIFSFCLFIKPLGFRFYRTGGKSYYWRSFSFILSSNINVFFPWLESSLNSSFFSVQCNVFRSRFSQISFFRVVFSLIRRFLEISSIDALFNYKKFNVVGIRCIIKGRVLNNKFCRVFKRINFGESCLTVKNSGYNFVFNSVDYRLFVSY